MILNFICFFHIKMEIPKLIELDILKLNEDEYNKVKNIYLKQEYDKLKQENDLLKEINKLKQENDKLLREKSRNEITKNNYDILTGKTKDKNTNKIKKINYKYKDENGNIFTGEETFNYFFNKHFNKKETADVSHKTKMKVIIEKIEKCNCMKEVDIYVDNLEIKI